MSRLLNFLFSDVYTNSVELRRQEVIQKHNFLSLKKSFVRCYFSWPDWSAPVIQLTTRLTPKQRFDSDPVPRCAVTSCLSWSRYVVSPGLIRHASWAWILSWPGPPWAGTHKATPWTQTLSSGPGPPSLLGPTKQRPGPTPCPTSVPCHLPYALVIDILNYCLIIFSTCLAALGWYFENHYQLTTNRWYALVDGLIRFPCAASGVTLGLNWLDVSFGKC